MGKQPTSSERPDRIVACRVTPAQHEQLVAAARATDQNVSEYLRDILFAATEASADALRQAYLEGARASQADAQWERAAVEAERDQERQLRVHWQQQAGKLERHLRITSGRLTFSVMRVLENGRGARAEFARLWACLDADEQERMLPVLAIAIVERVHDVCQTAGRSDLKYVQAVDAKARWLSATLTPASAETGYPAPAQAHVTGLALCVATMLLTEWYLQRFGYLAQPTATDPPAAPEPPPVAPAQWNSDPPPLVVDELKHSDGLPQGDQFVAASPVQWPPLSPDFYAVEMQGRAAPYLSPSVGVGPRPTSLIASPPPTPASERDHGRLSGARDRDDLRADRQARREIASADADVLAAETSAGAVAGTSRTPVERPDQCPPLPIDPDEQVADINAPEPTDLERR